MYKKLLVFSILILFYQSSYPEINWKMSQSNEINKILSLEEQAKISNEILEWRLDSILPKVMRREGIDLWLIINFEYDEDPVYLSLVKKPAYNARRLSILIFHDSPKEGFKKLTANWWGKWSCGPMYESIFTDRKKGSNHQFTVIAEYIKKHNPQKIGINYADHYDYHDGFSHGLGLSAFLKEKLERALEPKYKKRLVSAEKVCMGWFETRSPRELELYRHICGVSHDLIAEFYSNKMITPGTTNVKDLQWRIKQRTAELTLDTWFHPSIEIKRSPEDSAKYGKDDEIIRWGDIIHCDIGISYLSLNGDMQHNAYVCRKGESGPPKGLIELYKKGNKVQEIMFAEFKEGKTGNEILKNIKKSVKSAGIEAKIYTHPIGIYGHSSGMMVGMWDKQKFVPGTGEHPLYPNTVYAIEFGINHTVPEWQNKKVFLGFEDNGMFTKDGANWVDGYPKSFYLIK